MLKSIKTILMERDEITDQEATDLISEATADLMERLGNGEMPYDICEEWFGLEPDYLFELIP